MCARLQQPSIRLHRNNLCIPPAATANQHHSCVHSIGRLQQPIIRLQQSGTRLQQPNINSSFATHGMDLTINGSSGPAETASEFTGRHHRRFVWAIGCNGQALDRYVAICSRFLAVTAKHYCSVFPFPPAMAGGSEVEFDMTAANTTEIGRECVEIVRDLKKARDIHRINECRCVAAIRRGYNYVPSRSIVMSTTAAGSSCMPSTGTMPLQTVYSLRCM